jgi:hypothetical protein
MFWSSSSEWGTTVRQLARRLLMACFAVLVSLASALHPPIAQATTTVDTVVVIGKKPGAQSAWDQFLEFLAWLADIAALIWNFLVNMLAPEDVGLLDVLAGYEPPCIHPGESSQSWSARASAACVAHAMNAANSRLGPLAGPAVTTLQGLCGGINADLMAREMVPSCQ